MNAYELKQADRRERMLGAAARAEAASTAAYERARGAVDGIPFGQPILVGHHSERRHRGALARHDASMRRAVELDKLAKSLRARAEGVDTNGISSDDPDAVGKLGDKVEALEKTRDLMKRINKIFKASGGRANYEWAASMLANAVQAGEVPRDMVTRGLRTLEVCHYESAPFPACTLTNIGARIRDAKKRTARLEQVGKVREALAAESDTGDAQKVFPIGDASVTVDLDDNRVVLRFAARLSMEHYKRVRSAGYLWSPSRNAFVRKFSGGYMVQMAKTLVASIIGAEVGV